MEDWNWEYEQEFQDFMESWANAYLCDLDAQKTEEETE